MPFWVKSCCLAFVVLIALCPGARAQASGSGPLYDPKQLPVFHGTVQLFTLTPRGDIEGFVLADGVEVKTPPHLTAAIAGAIKPGDRVTVHGLKAASLPLVQAMSVSNDATGVAVVDAGPDAARAASSLPVSQDASPVPFQGRLRQSLHGPRGDVNGALLDDGTVLKLPPPEALRFGDLLTAGRRIAAEGIHYTTPVGGFVMLTALGPAGGRLETVSGNPPPPLPAPMPAVRPHG